MIETSPHDKLPHPEWVTGLLLFSFLLSLYLLTYTGEISSADEVSMLAVTENFDKRQTFNTDQLVWTVWAHNWMAQGSLGVDGHIYSKKGVGISLLVWPFYRLARYFGTISQVHLVFLFNPIVCAATGILVWLTAKSWGYKRSIALSLGLLTGSATMLWPYAKTLFLEPAVGLALLSLVYCITGTHSRIRIYLGGLALSLALSLRLTNALAGLLSALYLLAVMHRENPKGYKERVTDIFHLALLPTLAAGLLLYFNWLRFGEWLSSGYTPQETFSTSFGIGLLGLLLSADKSIFIFSPILLLALPGGIALIRSPRRHEAILVFTLALTNLLVFASWYDWGGGLAWGPRFLVALIPILMLLTAPVFDWASRRTSGGLVVGLLAVISVAIQIAGAFTSYHRSYAPEYGSGPIATAFGLLRTGQWDNAWMSATGEFLWPVVTGSLGIGGLAAILLWLYTGPKILRPCPWVTINSWPWVGIASIILTIGILALAGWGLSHIFSDQRLRAGDDYRTLAQYLDKQAQASDAIILDDHTLTEFFLYYDNSPARRYDFLRSSALTPEEEALLEKLVTAYTTIWLISRPATEGIRETEESWLDTNAYFVEEQRFSDFARLREYFIPPPESIELEKVTIDYSIGVQLHGLELPTTSMWKPDGVVPVAVHWDTTGSTLPMRTSLQLLNSQEQIIWQRDESLEGVQINFALHYAIPLPANLPTGDYLIALIVYNAQNGQRFIPRGLDQTSNADFLTIQTLHVQTTENYAETVLVR